MYMFCVYAFIHVHDFMQCHTCIYFLQHICFDYIHIMICKSGNIMYLCCLCVYSDVYMLPMHMQNILTNDTQRTTI